MYEQAGDNCINISPESVDAIRGACETVFVFLINFNPH